MTKEERIELLREFSKLENRRAYMLACVHSTAIGDHQRSLEVPLAECSAALCEVKIKLEEESRDREAALCANADLITIVTDAVSKINTYNTTLERAFTRIATLEQDNQMAQAVLRGK